MCSLSQQTRRECLAGAAADKAVLKDLGASACLEPRQPRRSLISSTGLGNLAW
jgi:hypothetical protein